MAWTASYTAAWTTAMSRKPTGPGRGGDAVEIVSAAMAFQSRTASARAICHQLTAANVMTGTVVTRLSSLFERMRDMAFSLSGRGDVSPRLFEAVQIRAASLTLIAVSEHISSVSLSQIDCIHRAVSAFSNGPPSGP